MISATATATEIKNNFGRYLAMVIDGNEVIITKNGTEVGRMVPREMAVSYLTDSLTGILQGNYHPDEELEKGLKQKYEIAD